MGQPRLGRKFIPTLGLDLVDLGSRRTFIRVDASLEFLEGRMLPGVAALD